MGPLWQQLHPSPAANFHRFHHICALAISDFIFASSTHANVRLDLMEDK